jgi:hypothetical protein
VTTINQDMLLTLLPIQAPILQWANTIIDPDTRAFMEYHHLMKSPKHGTAWIHSFSNEIGRLAQGVGGRIKSTNTIFFMPHSHTHTFHTIDAKTSHMDESALIFARKKKNPIERGSPSEATT